MCWRQCWSKFSSTGSKSTRTKYFLEYGGPEMSWLVTGGCGFIGTSLISHLRGQNAPVIRVLDNLSVGLREQLAAVAAFREIAHASIGGAPRGVELVVGDVRGAACCNAACEGIETTVHLAANTGVAPAVGKSTLGFEVH